MSNQTIPNALARPLAFPTSAQLNAANRNPSSGNITQPAQRPSGPLIRPVSNSTYINASPKPSGFVMSNITSQNLQRPSTSATANASRPLVNFAGGRAPAASPVVQPVLVRPTVQPPPRMLAPETHLLSSVRAASVPHSTPSVPNVIKRKRSSDEEEDEEEEDEDDDDEDDDDSEDDDEEDDSIVVSDNEEVALEDDIPDDNDEDSARALAEILKKEATEFIKTPLTSSCVGGRSLRNRATLKKPDQSHIELIREAYELDEKKELIKELSIWKNTLASQAAAASVVWPVLKPSMPLEVVRREHDIVRKKLALESSDDEDSDLDEEEEEDEEDLSASVENEDEEDDDDSTTSMEDDDDSEDEE